MNSPERRVLLVGWFSFEEMGATAGDLLVRDVVAGWIDLASIPYDVALARPFSPRFDWRETDPDQYSDLIFVCGPFGNGPPVTELLERFSHCRLYGINLSLLEPLEIWNPFYYVIARDSSTGAAPDLAFLGIPDRVPVVGVVKVHPQEEYGSRGRHTLAHAMIDELLANQEVARVNIDTRLDMNTTELRTPAEITSLIGRMDAIVTTRLHGCVLGLAQGVPVLAIDPIAGGAKITRQLQEIGWPYRFLAESVSGEDLAQALAQCLRSEARHRAIQCRDGALERIALIAEDFRAALRDG